MGRGGKDCYALLCIYAQNNHLTIEAEWKKVEKEDASWAYILRVGKLKVIGYCDKNGDALSRIETKDRVCGRMWGLLMNKRVESPSVYSVSLKQTQRIEDNKEEVEEWLDWGRKNILEKYPKPVLNDKNYLIFPPTSFIMVFEFGFQREPFMVVLMDPNTKEVNVYPYKENEEEIRTLMKDEEVEKAVFHKTFLERALGMKFESARDLIPDAECHYQLPLPNIGELLKVQYNQSFTFQKQYRRWGLESDSNTWSPNVIDTGVLQAISLYELIQILRENPPQKKRRLH